MIIDCFTFYNELDILDIRLNTLSNSVDKFVLVEASKTQSLLDKPFYFEENKGRYANYLDKIVHVKVSEFPENGGWAMENFQRNCITRGLKQIDLKNNDIIAISDVDEIWNPDSIQEIEKKINYNDFLCCEMKYIVFFLNLETKNKKWIGTVFTSAKNLKNKTPQNLRQIKDFIPKLEFKGWHFGNQGGKEAVYNKFFSCIEPFDKSLIPPFEKFSQEFDRKIKNGGSFLFSDKIDDSIEINEIPISRDFLPQYLFENHLKFSKLIWKP